MPQVLNIEQLQPKYAKSLSVPSTTTTSGEDGSPKEPTVMVIGEPHQQFHKYHQHLQQLGYTAIHPAAAASSPTQSPNQEQQPMLIAVTPNEVSSASSSVFSPISSSIMPPSVVSSEMMRKISNFESISKLAGVGGGNIIGDSQPIHSSSSSSSSSQMVYYVVHTIPPQTDNPPKSTITTASSKGVKSQLGSDKNNNSSNDVIYTSYRDVVTEDLSLIHI